MAKKARRPRARTTARLDPGAPVPVVGMREPCPCGSGRRYRLCHGRETRETRVSPPARPFEGLAGECDWVALRSFVASATSAPLRLAEDGAVPQAAGRTVRLGTVLPMAMAAQVTSDEVIWLATQTQDPGCGDPSRDLAAALSAALEAKPGDLIPGGGATLDGPRLQDLLDTTVAPVVTTSDTVNFWTEELADEAPSPEVAESIDRVNAVVEPSQRLTLVDAAYWVRVGDRTQVRWVMAYPEKALLDGLARLHAAGASALVDGGRLIGSFRACGLTIPVWDLPDDTSAEAVEEPAKVFADRLEEAVADATPLTVQERGARSGLMSRQVTVR